jgi:nucleoside-diphosphate-sugar epimerase
LYSQGHFVRIVDIKFDDYIEERYWSERLQLDLRILENCLQATEGIDKVYNLAANMGGIGFITSVSADVMRDNVLINTFMLEAAVRNKVKRFLFSSSACVYANYKQTTPDVAGLKEEDAYPADPNEAYGWEKLFTEEMMKSYQKDYGLNIRIARYHNIYGPEGTYKGGREKAPAALCRKVAEASDPGSITIWGDGKATRSFCYIDDCVKGTVMLMESDYDKPVNIGSDRLISIDELADLVIRISGKKITKNYDLSAPEGVRGRNADLTLVRKVLGWEPEVSLEDGMERTYRWVKMRVERDSKTGS